MLLRKGPELYVMKPDENSVSQAKELIASVLGGEGTVSDTQQTPRKDRGIHPHGLIPTRAPL